MDGMRAKLLTQQYDVPHDEGGDISMTTINDPAGTPAFAAVTTAIVDVYGGVIITTTTTGNDQTIQSPTNTTAGNRFTVANSSTSSNSININGLTIEPSEAQGFLWDGTAWIQDKFYVHPNHSGDVTSVADGAQTIALNAVTNAKAAQMATKTYKGRTTAGTGDAEDVAVATVKTDLALNNVDNTSDADKPVSTAQQTALDLKAPLADAAMTGMTTHVGLTIGEKTPINAVAATGTLTVTGATPQIANNDTVTIDAKVYTYKTTLTATEGEVLLGANDTAALLNLLNAINHTGTPGTDYECAAEHPTVTGTSSDATTLVVTAKTKGVSTIATTETGASIAWGAATLAGGVDGTVGVANETCADGSYFYHCLATNTVADTNWRKMTLNAL